MAKRKKDSYFWTSYSDLMTNMFFVMLMLFVLTIALLHRQVVIIEKEKKATEEQLKKITEIQDAIANLDRLEFFRYDEKYKKHVLTTPVKFREGSDDIKDLTQTSLDELLEVRDSLDNLLTRLENDHPDAEFLMVIEGQASKDSYAGNNQLSYNRALHLYEYWFPKADRSWRDPGSLRFGTHPCEIVLAGAGIYDGKPRAVDESDNQRFLINVILKPGKIEKGEDKSELSVPYKN